MFNEYFERSDNCKQISTLATIVPEITTHDNAASEVNEFKEFEQNLKLNNSDILTNLDSKLVHLNFDQREEIKTLVHSYKKLFPDVPNKTVAACHDVNFAQAAPVKQHPYRPNPLKPEVMRKEVK